MNRDSLRLLQLLDHYHLDFRWPKMLEPVRRRVEADKMRGDSARRWIKRILPLIRIQQREGNYLPRPPTYEEQVPDDEVSAVTVGRLVERPEVPLKIPLSPVRHVAVTGRPGSGKSVTLRQYAKKVHERGQTHPQEKAGLVIVQFKKDFDDARTFLGPSCRHYTIHGKNKIRFSLNGPKGVEYQRWTAIITLILAVRLGMIIARTCLAAIINWLIPLLNPNLNPNDPEHTPSIKLILSILKRSIPRIWAEKPDYAKTLIQLLSGLLSDGAGIFDAEKGFSINDEIAKGNHCVLDFSNLDPPYLRCLVVDLILMSLLVYRMHNRLKTDRTEICIVITEADLIVQPSAQGVYPHGLSPVFLIGRFGREYGIQLVIEVSSLLNVDDQLLAANGVLIALNTADAASINALVHTFQLDPRTTRFFPTLKEGICVFREAQGNYALPILGQIDFIAPDRSQNELQPDPITFSEPRDLEELPDVKKGLEQRIAEQRRKDMQDGKNNKEEDSLNKPEREFLDHMSLHPYEPVHAIFQRMGVASPATEKQIIKKLLKLKLILHEQTRFGSSFCRLALIDEKGCKLLNKDPNAWLGKGGITHTHICRWIQSWGIKNGYEESIYEWLVPGTAHNCDAGLKHNGKYVAVEVVVRCRSNILDHIKLCFQSEQIDSMMIVTCTKTQADAIRKRIVSDLDVNQYLQRISFQTAEFFMRSYIS